MKSRLLSLVCFSLIIASSCSGEKNSLKTRGVQGKLDLSNWDSAKNGPIKLEGEWQFFWKQLATDGKKLTPAGIRMLEERNHAGFARTPENWRLTNKNPQATPAFGYGTYLLKVTWPPDVEKMAYYQISLPNAYRVWSVSPEGKLHSLISSGTVGHDRKTEQPRLRNSVGYFRASETKYIILETSNFSISHTGGMNRTGLVGTESGVNAYIFRLHFGDIWVMGFLLFIAVYHALLFSLRRKLYSAPALAVLCLALGLRNFLTGRYFQELAPGIDFFGTGVALEFITVPIAMSATLFFTKYIVGTVRARHTFWILQGLSIPAILSILITPVEIYTRFLIPFIIYVIANMLWMLYILIIESIRAEGEMRLTARLAGSFFCIYLFFVGRDILITLTLLDGLMMAPYGLFIFMLGHTYIIARSNAQAHKAAENLSSELNKINEMKDEFLANTSHELRTPLNGVIGIVESLLQGAGGKLEEAARFNLKMVVTSARRLTNLVNDILDFSRIRHGDFRLRFGALDLSSSIDVALAISRPLIAGKELEFKKELPPNLPLVRADEDRVQQILLNLLGNAVKFTQSGGITVSARKQDDAVTVSVTDTGIGIPAEKQRMVFDSFTQADGSISREYGGTGLGLTISRQLVELHGGVMELESIPGQGSMFSFTLPLADADLLAPPPTLGRVQTSLPETKDPTPTPPPLLDFNNLPENARTLIVDDDPVNLQVLKNHLRLQKIAVSQASNGQEALSMLDKEQFDLVLLDVMMPGLSGYEVCRLLREKHSRSELPVIMLTAKTRMNDLLTGLESGANDYLTKPFDSRELMARVDNMLQLKKAAESQSRLENLDHELKLARGIQQSLLPSELPERPDLDFAARYHSMYKVGGDFYDFQTNHSGVGTLIADVSGHGVPAALLVSIVKVAFWFQKELIEKPDALLESMNEILLNNIGNEFVTACYVWLDMNKKVLHTGNAGHPPLLVWRPRTEELHTIRPFGHVLGIMENMRYVSREIPVESGDRILMYTDGVYDAQNASGEEFNENRLQDLMKANQHLNANEFADFLLKSLMDWSSTEKSLSDDIAFIVIDVEP